MSATNPRLSTVLIVGALLGFLLVVLAWWVTPAASQELHLPPPPPLDQLMGTYVPPAEPSPAVTQLRAAPLLAPLSVGARGTGWVSPFAARPDPWAHMRAFGAGWEEALCLRPGLDSVAETYAERLDVPLAVVYERTGEGAALYDARYQGQPFIGDVPSWGLCGAIPRWNAEYSTVLWPRVLQTLCVSVWKPPGLDCVPTAREIEDAAWSGPGHLVCQAMAAGLWPGASPENAATRCDATRPRGATWTETSGWGCTMHFRQQRPECGTAGSPPPPPPPPPDPDPLPEPDCEPLGESRFLKSCQERHGGVLEDCRAKAARFPGSTLAKLLARVCPEPSEPPLGPAVRTFTADEVRVRQRFVPGAPSTGKLEIELVGATETMPPEED